MENMGEASNLTLMLMTLAHFVHMLFLVVLHKIMMALESRIAFGAVNYHLTIRRSRRFLWADSHNKLESL